MLGETEKAVLKLIKEKGSISRVDISRMLKISKPVVSQIVGRLIEQGFVKETGKKEGSSRGGRRPILLSFVPESRYVIGVDVGGTKLDAALTDLNGRILERRHTEIPERTGREDLLEHLLSVLRPLLKGRNVLGVGIGIPGTVDENFVVKRLPAFRIENWNLKKELENLLDVPIFIENNANLDAFAESKVGAGVGYRCVLLISIGWGVGAGIVYRGEIFRGARGKVGEFGHIVTDWTKDRAVTPEEGFGHLEEWFSGFSLKKRFGKPPDMVFEEHLCELREGMEHFAVAVANAIVLLDPDVVIIKGGIGSHQFEKIVSVLETILKEIVPRDILEDVAIRKGKIEEFGVTVGGALFVMERTLGL